jgi:hypothetical protein
MLEFFIRLFEALFQTAVSNYALGSTVLFGGGACFLWEVKKLRADDALFGALLIMIGSAPVDWGLVAVF